LGLLTFINPSLNLYFARHIIPFVVVVAGWTMQKFFRNKPLTITDGGIFLGLVILYIVRMLTLYKLEV
jgi:hypothetical protein